MMLSNRNWLLVVLAALALVGSTTAQEQRQHQLRHHSAANEQKRHLLLDWISGIWGGSNSNNGGDAGTSGVAAGDDTNTAGNDLLDGVSDFFDGILGGLTGGDGGDENNSEEGNTDGDADTDTTDNDPFGFIQDIFDPITDAFDRAQDSEEPLSDFLEELLNSTFLSKTPFQDWIDQAFGRSDRPLLDWIANLFNSTNGTTPIQDFVEDLLDGSRNPLQDALNNWMGGMGDMFSEIGSSDALLNCSSSNDLGDVATKNLALPCAYNLEGDLGVWVCRTIYNPINGSAMSETYCANPLYTWSAIEECGACPDDVPTVCPCSCNWTLTDDGARVLVDDAITGQPVEQCVNKAWATGAVHRFAGLSCVAASECAV